MVAPALCMATVFSTAGGRSDRLIFFSWAEAAPASSKPTATHAIKYFVFMISPRRGEWLPSTSIYLLLPKHRINMVRDPPGAAPEQGCAIAGISLVSFP